MFNEGNWLDDNVATYRSVVGRFEMVGGWKRTKGEPIKGERRA